MGACRLFAGAGHLGSGKGPVKDGAALCAWALCIGLFAPSQIARFGHHHSRKPSMRALFLVIDLALELYIWVVIAAAIFSWLVAFNVVNTRNQFVGAIGQFLYRITEPALRPIRNMLPNLGGIDISPVILFLIIIFIRYVIALYILPNVF